MKSSKTVRTRPLRLQEIAEMVGVWKASGLSYKPRGRDSMLRLRAQWRADPKLFLGAFIMDELVGVALLSHDNRKGWINRLAVVPCHRRKGIAALLIARAEKAFKERDIHIYCVHIEEDHPESESLFKKSGYSREDSIRYFTKRERKEY